MRELLECFGIGSVDLARVTILCGAGISYPAPTRLPTVAAFVEGVVEHCTDDPAARAQVLAAMRSGSAVTPRFEVLVNAITRLGIDATTIGQVFDSAFPNSMHGFLARQCESGAVVLTTNFDNCIERATPRNLARVVFDGKDLEALGASSATIVKPHGSNPLDEGDGKTSLVVSIAALAKTARGFRMFPVWREYLNSILANRVIVVLGYSGSDDFDMTPVLLASNPEHVLWLDYAPETPLRKTELSEARQNVRNICDRLRTTYVRGDLEAWLSSALGSTHHCESNVQPPTLKRWLDAVASSNDVKQSLLCVVARHFGLHELTIQQTGFARSAEAKIQRGVALYYTGRYEEALQVLELASSLHLSDRQRCETLYLLSSAAFYGGDLDQARLKSGEHVSLAEAMGDVGELQTALVNAAALDFSAGARDLAREKYERVLSLQDSAPSFQPAAMSEWGLADLASVDGDLDEATRRYLTAQELCRQLGSAQGLAWTSANLAEVLVRRGEWERASAALDQAEPFFTAQGIAAGQLQVLGCRARLDYSSGRLSAAEQTVERSLPLLSAHGESAAMLMLVPLAYLLSADSGRSQLLSRMKQVVGASVVRATQHHREGAVQAQWALCREVVEGNENDLDLYARCREWVIGDDLTAEASGDGALA